MLNEVCTNRSRIIIFVRSVLELGRSGSYHSFTLVLFHLVDRYAFFIAFCCFWLNLLCRRCVVRFLSSNTKISSSKIRNINTLSMLCLCIWTISLFIGCFIIKLAIISITNRKVNFSGRRCLFTTWWDKSLILLFRLHSARPTKLFLWTWNRLSFYKSIFYTLQKKQTYELRCCQ